MSYLDLLPHELYCHALAKTNLTDFQTKYRESINSTVRYITFKERYFAKYGTTYSKVDHEFNDDQNQYLFCAGHFHMEIGFRSHLLVPIEICIRGAIKQHQPELVEYFIERGGKIDTGAINLIIQFDVINCAYLIPQFPKEMHATYYPIYPETRVLSFDMAKELAKKFTAVKEIYRDRPIDEYLTFDEILSNLSTGTRDRIDDHSIMGQIFAGHTEFPYNIVVKPK
jgi:hypothetical protein